MARKITREVVDEVLSGIGLKLQTDIVDNGLLERFLVPNIENRIEDFESNLLFGYPDLNDDQLDDSYKIFYVVLSLYGSNPFANTIHNDNVHEVKNNDRNNRRTE